MAGLYEKAGLLKKLIDVLAIPAGEVVYIGDETRDITAGKKCGVKTIGVTWGLNGRESLLAENPDWLVCNPEQLRKLFR
jgi:phosphoglycolate phosphatase-like HAD superfamily hydrolase